MGRIRFRDREDAGRQLAVELRGYANERPLVLAIPNGGVPVAFEIARALSCELDVWVAKKLGLPWYPALGVGAIAEGGQLSLSRALIEDVNLSGVELAQVTETKRREVDAFVQKYRAGRARPNLRLRTVIIVDDGVSTGGTANAAIESIRAEGPRRLVLAVPVATPSVLSGLGQHVDRVVCLNTPTELYALGVWYDDFPRATDEQVLRFLERARHGFSATQAAAKPAPATLPTASR